jgi:hypothetical protein
LTARPAPPPPAGRTIDFAGHTWTVKSSNGRIGPGPNYFSSSTDNVWVDGAGLHMKITKSKNRWNCAEVILNGTLGYGTYRFHLATPVDNLDPSVVLGLFTWNDNPADNHHELDIEFARWGAAGNMNAQYVVQPYTDPDNILRFGWPPNNPVSSHSFTWLPTQVTFECVANGSSVVEWTATQGIPPTGGENARINLWLFQGRAPTNGQAVEVIISDFEFIPMP